MFEVNKEKRIVRVNNIEIGGERPVFIAGPCSIESRDHIIEEAKILKEIGVDILRGGAFKPRTCPDDFQGLGMEAVGYLVEARDQTGLPFITEVLSEYNVEEMEEMVDVFQVGSRNMYNYALLKKLGKSKKPVLLKRGFSASIREWIKAAEYIIQEGNPNVILCERGIRTYTDYTRNTLDLAGAVLAKELSGLPVIVDPSHATGLRELIEPMSKAALAAGLDGLIIEVHEKPECALTDSRQTIDYSTYRKIRGAF